MGAILRGYFVGIIARLDIVVECADLAGVPTFGNCDFNFHNLRILFVLSYKCRTKFGTKQTYLQTLFVMQSGSDKYFLF